MEQLVLPGFEELMRYASVYRHLHRSRELLRDSVERMDVAESISREESLITHGARLRHQQLSFDFAQEYASPALYASSVAVERPRPCDPNRAVQIDTLMRRLSGGRDN